jgi:hypothetical protein
VRAIVRLRELPTLCRLRLVPATDQVLLSSDTGYLPPRRNTAHLLVRTPTGHLPGRPLTAAHLPRGNMEHHPKDEARPIHAAGTAAEPRLLLRRVAASFDEPPVFDLGVIEADARLLTLQKRFVNSMQAASLLRAVLWPLDSG